MKYSHIQLCTRIRLKIESSYQQAPTYQLLGHPIWWLFLIILLLNDHYLKGAGIFPGWFTGKVSDVAGMVVAPVLAVVLFRTNSLHQRIVAYAAVAIPFVLINVWQDAASLVETCTSKVGIPWKIWVDPTDLMALGVLPFTILWIERSMEKRLQPQRIRRHLLAHAGAMSWCRR